jgi:hypothetical protein
MEVETCPIAQHSITTLRRYAQRNRNSKRPGSPTRSMQTWISVFVWFASGFGLECSCCVCFGSSLTMYAKPASETSRLGLTHCSAAAHDDLPHDLMECVRSRDGTRLPWPVRAATFPSRHSWGLLSHPRGLAVLWRSALPAAFQVVGCTGVRSSVRVVRKVYGNSSVRCCVE